MNRLKGGWQRTSTTVAEMTWLERITAALALFCSLLPLRLAPTGVRVVRRRLLDAL